MTSVLQIVFANFWTFVGSVILLWMMTDLASTVFAGIATMITAARGRGPKP